MRNGTLVSTLAEVRRILIVGPTGSGKTTLAHELGDCLELPVVELDTLHWGPNWSVQDGFPENAFARVCEGVWVIEGGYTVVHERAWPRADLVVWLDLPFPLVFSQLMRRTLGRIVTGEEIFHGNHESIRQTFFSRESVVAWLFRSYRGRRRQCETFSRQHPEVPVVRLRTRTERDGWLDSAIPDRPAGSPRTGA